VTVAGERLTVTLELDESGHVVRTGSTVRELKREGEWQATPWGGTFHDAPIGPLYLPTAGEAYSDLDTGRYVLLERAHHRSRAPRRRAPAMT
jgi:hypothetical protein